ncbi:hypothetical protein Tco_1013968 [Tanacetum coccineum]
MVMTIEGGKGGGKELEDGKTTEMAMEKRAHFKTFEVGYPLNFNREGRGVVGLTHFGPWMKEDKVKRDIHSGVLNEKSQGGMYSLAEPTPSDFKMRNSELLHAGPDVNHSVTGDIVPDPYGDDSVDNSNGDDCAIAEVNDSSRDSSLDSSSEASSDFHSVASPDSPSRHSSSGHSSPDSPSLSLARADLLPPPKRIRSFDSVTDLKEEIDECIAYADSLRAGGIDARVVVETVAREDKVTHPVVSDDIPEPA